ncbi:MAG: hypothetical protein ACK6CU_22890 [Deltaproteobacteria bacterium]|jgi:hypothetical protein
MLPPDARKLYVDALSPPTGYELDEALCTTYSLSLESLLAVPVNLVLGSIDAKKLGSDGDVWILESIRRVARHLTLFCDADCIAPPAREHILFSLLEPAVVPVRAPGGGAFHPKVWLLRFRPAEGDGPAWLRVLVLTRNLSPDRSWDLSLLLEGRVTGAYVAAQRPLGQLVEQLLALVPAHAGLDRERADRLRALGEDARKTQLQLPGGFGEVAFHLLGFDGKQWLPDPSERLVVVSPFVTKTALEALASTTREAVALVSRTEELARIAPSVLQAFGRIATLNEAAETEDGEDAEAASGLRGLHAKLYLAKRGWNTHVYVGSANATHAALLGGGNVEVLAELVGKTSQVGEKGIDGFLGERGVGPLLVDYSPPAEQVVDDPDAERARFELEKLGRSLETAGLRVRYEVEGDAALPTLEVERPAVLDRIETLTSWLVTTDAQSSSADVKALGRGEPAALPRCSVAATSRFVAFACTSATHPHVRHAIVLQVPAIDLPANRDDHIARLVVNNRDRFLQYLSALLAGLDEDALPASAALGGGDSVRAARSLAESGLLERLVRARSRHPERLDDVRRLVESLRATTEGTEVVPPEFFEVWDIVAGEPS